MSEKNDQEYLADGMAEEILNLLAQVPDLPSRAHLIVLLQRQGRRSPISRESSASRTSSKAASAGRAITCG